MTHEDKIQYMRIAGNICQFGFTHEQLDLLVSLHELIVKKKGNADMRDVATVQAGVKERAFEKEKQDIKEV